MFNGFNISDIKWEVDAMPQILSNAEVYNVTPEG